MLKRLKLWLNQLLYRLENPLRNQQANQLVLIWRFWLGIIVTVAVVLYIELGRRAGVVVPIPFLILFGSVVLTANIAGLRAGLISAAIATVFITYSASISFGPSTLTGGPLQVLLGALLLFLIVFFLGHTKSKNEVKDANRTLQQEVAEYKQALKSLRESEARYRNIVETQTELVSRTAPDGTLIFVNDAYCRQFGQTREQLLGRNFTNFFVEEDRQGVHQIALSLTPEKPVVTHEHREYRPDGSIGWYQWTAQGIFDEKGQLLEIQSVGRDITGRKRAEEALRESEARYRAIVEIQPELVSRTAPDGTITFVNGAYCRQFGKTPEELLGANYINFVIEEDRQAVHEKNLSLTPENPLMIDEHREYRPDGSIGWFRWTDRGIFDKKGQLIEVQSVGRDITRRKQAEEALRESEARYRAIVETQTEFVSRKTPDGTLTFVNDAYCHHFGQAREALVGTNYINFVVEEDRQVARERDMSLTPENPVATDEHREYRPDGSIGWYRWTDRGIFDEEGQLVELQSVGRDITRRKQAEEALRESEAQLRTLFELLPVGVSVLSPERQLVDINTTLERILSIDRDGLFRGDYDQRRYLRADGSPRPPAEFASMRAVAEQQPVHNVRTGVVKEDGDIVWTEVSAAPLPDGRVVVVTTDITERKRAEEKLLESEARYRAVVEDQTEFISRTTSDGTIIFVNDAYCRQFGQTREELLGKNIINFVLEEDRQAIIEKRAVLTPQNPVSTSEHREYRPDGSLAWYQWTGRAIFDEKGQLIEMQSVGRDITKRKEAEEALQESEARFQRLVEVAFEAIGISDQGTIVDINDQAGQMYGYEPAEMIGMSALDFVAPEARELVQKNIMSRNDGPYEHLALRKDGSTFPVEIRVRDFPYKGRMLRVGVIRDMTRYKEAEKALRESEARFRTVWDISADALALSDAEGIVLDANPAYFELYGFTADNVINQPFNIIFPEAQRGWAMEQYKAVFASPTVPPAFESDVQYANGAERNVETKIGFITRNGERIMMLSSIRDMTEHHRTQDALRMSEERFSAAFHANPAAIAIGRLEDLCYLDANESFLKFTGYRREEVVGHTPIELNLSVEADDPAKIVQVLQEDGQIRNQEVPFRTKSGEIRLGLASLEIIELDRKPHVLGMFLDITERKKAEEALCQSEERFSRAFHLNPSAITILTLKDLCYLDVNESFLKATGYHREEVVGHTVSELNLVVNTEERDEVLQALQAKGRMLNKEISFRTKSGEIRVALVSQEIIELDHEPCILSIFLDVTERKQLEEQHQQRQRLEAISQLAAGIAHDFNNRLLVINGLAEKMGLDLAPDSPHQESLNQIIQSGQQSADLVRQLLAFSRKQIVQPKVLNLNTIVTGMNKMLGSAIGENIELETKLEQDLWLVKADPSQIEQIIVNLALNARDAMPEGGRLIIETANEVLDEDYVAYHLESQAGEYVRLTVSDTGHGISEEIKSHIFDPFFTTKEQGKGPGLGLASIYGIVRQNRGNIWVDSEEGVGTTFKIYLPREKETPSLVSPHSKDATETVFGTETILLVEDSSTARHLMGTVLAAQGYTLLEAQDGSEALQLAAQYQGVIHLLLTDIIMPGMKGTVLAKELTQVRSDLKVMFITGYTESEVLGRGIQSSDIDLLQKPFSPTTLIHKVRGILDG